MNIMLRVGTLTASAFAFALLALTLLPAAACVVNEPEAPTRGVVVSGPPPAPVAEPRPPAPNPQSSWVPGYWHWTGMQYAWIPGHWESAPAGQAWAAPRITNTQDGRYIYESGGWHPTAASSKALR